MNRLLSCIQSCLQQQALTVNDIGKVFLVGGSAQIPSIQDSMKKMFGDRVHLSKHCQEIIAEGATIHAGLKQTYECILQ